MGEFEKGSFTLEAAVVFPMTLFVLLFLLSLFLYVHDYAWYTAAAWECVIGGSGDSSDSRKDISEEILNRADKRQREYWGRNSLFMELTVDEEKTEALYQGAVSFFMGLPEQNYRVDITLKRIRPVRFIRKCRALKEIAAESGG